MTGRWHTTHDKLEQVETLTRRGWTVADACYQVGLDQQTWYRRRPPEIELDQAQAVLDILALLAGKVREPWAG